MTIAEDAVKVNGKLTELDVLTMYELDAEIGRCYCLVVLTSKPDDQQSVF